jgi:hypothetical protein
MNKNFYFGGLTPNGIILKFGYIYKTKYISLIKIYIN